VNLPAWELPGFDILAEVGRGTTGLVYRAKDVRLNRVVALKVLDLGPAAERAMRVARFQREAQVVASLTWKPDPTIPALHAVMEHRGQPHYIRDFVEGKTLEQCAAVGSFKLAEGIRVLEAVARAVARVHARGVAHRNLHPSNVLVAADGAAKLIGFGRVGPLAESELITPGAAGTPAEIDVHALQGMLNWLSSALGQPLPSHVEPAVRPGAASSAAELAVMLGSILE